MAESSAQRSYIIDHLKTNNIPAMIYYRIPLHLQLVFQNLGYKAGDFPVAEKVANNIFSIPMHPYIQQDQQDRILETLHSAK